MEKKEFYEKITEEIDAKEFLQMVQDGKIDAKAPITKYFCYDTFRGDAQTMAEYVIDLLDSFYNQLSKTGYKSDKILNYRRICNIFSTPNRTDLIIKSFNISITFLIAYIINVYVEFNYKSNTNGNLSFSNYYINNTSGSAFNIDNFWNFINSSLTQTIKIKSTEIKLYKHTPEFNNLEKKDQNIIETYIREFNL